MVGRDGFESSTIALKVSHTQ